MTTVAIPASRFDLGRVFGLAAESIGRRWLAYGLMLLVIGWAPAVLAEMLVMAAMRPTSVSAGYGVLAGAAQLVAVVTPFLMRATVIALALAPAGERGWAAAARGLAASPALAPVWLLSSLPQIARFALLRDSPLSLMAAGLLLTVFAWSLAVVLTLTLGVYTPAVIAERLGPLRAAARSMRLMGAGRWKFFATFLLMQLLGWLPTPIVLMAVAASGVFAQASGLSGALMQGSGLQVFIWEGLGIQLLVDVVLVWWSVLAAMSYREMVRVREGAAPADVADIFG